MDKAKYILDIRNQRIEFLSKKLSLDKCLQIKRISNKKWNGFSLKEIEYDLNGLIFIHITNPDMYLFNSNNRIILMNTEIKSIEYKTNWETIIDEIIISQL